MKKNKSGISFKVYANINDMSDAAARHIVNLIRQNNKMLLCPAAGSSPVKTYEKLVEYLQADGLNPSELRVIKLDEWLGVSSGSSATCEQQIYTQLIKPLGLINYFGFSSDCTNPTAELAECNKFLAVNGPVDLCILGLGVNGHLGFNEPADTYLRPFPHIARLSGPSQGHQMVAGLPDKPHSGITLGMHNILTARNIILLVSGVNKKEALAQLRKAQISTSFPASFLWLHANVICFCDVESYG